MEGRSVFPRMYKLREIAEVLNLSYESSRRLVNEIKGVVRFGHPEMHGTRRYYSPRLTEPQLKALIARLSQ
jgi:hypothetical protein